MLIWERSLNSLWTVLIRFTIYSTVFQTETTVYHHLHTGLCFRMSHLGRLFRAKQITLPPGVTIKVSLHLTSALCGAVVGLCIYVTVSTLHIP